MPAMVGIMRDTLESVQITRAKESSDKSFPVA